MVAWQIDAFGHASSTPGVLRSLGFTHVVLNRIPEKVGVVRIERDNVFGFRMS